MKNYTNTFFVIWIFVIICKLFGLISIPWFWVFSPFWFIVGISVLIGILISLLVCITGFILLIKTFNSNDRN